MSDAFRIPVGSAKPAPARPVPANDDAKHPNWGLIVALTLNGLLWFGAGVWMHDAYVTLRPLLGAFQ
jgi:hypothetical protein